MVPLYTMIFKKPTSRIIDATKEAIVLISDWFIEKDYTFIRIYRAIKKPHLLLKYILDMPTLSRGSITIYHSWLQRFIGEALKGISPQYPFTLGIHIL